MVTHLFSKIISQFFHYLILLLQDQFSLVSIKVLIEFFKLKITFYWFLPFNLANIMICFIFGTCLIKWEFSILI